jgi:LCP family protein required for cell wall assembly
MNRSRLTWAAIGCCLVLVVWPSLAIGAASPQPTVPPLTSEQTARPLDRTQNILILGSDQRPGQSNWNTDTLMVAAVDWDNGQVGLLSVPRDLWVDIPGVGKGRINTADEIGAQEHYPGGGPALVSATLSNALGIQTRNYVRIKMPALVQAIDAMGGITVTLDIPYYDLAPDQTSPTHYTNIAMPAGPNHLDGRSTLGYVRARLETNDFDRTRRQQQVIWAIRQRFFELNWLSRLPDLWSAYQNHVETDLSWWDILRLAWFGAGLKSNQVHGRVFGYDLLTPYVTEEGADVLIITDRQKVDAWVDGLFSAPPPGERTEGPRSGTRRGQDLTRLRDE